MSGGGPEKDPGDYFGSAYRSYEGQNPPKKLDHYADVLRARSPVSKPRLLDVGCGRGLFLRRLHDRFPEWQLSGTDPEPGGVSASSSLVPSATIRQGFVDSIPFPTASFDVVSAWDVLEHVIDLGAALSEMKRCLVPGGVLAVVIPVYDSVSGPLIRALDRDPTHIHKESRDFWVSLIEKHFSAVQWHGIYRFMISGSKYVHWPTRMLRRATPAILVSAITG